ncbi:MAG: zinc metallopeptidase [Clostridia bacterium]
MYNNMYYGNDPWLLAVFAMLIVSFIVQGSVQRTFKRFSSLAASSGITAADMADHLLRDNGSSVSITQVPGMLTDHFNPKTNVVGLSDAVYGQRSVAALAVAAHEIGHVLQHEQGYAPIKLRNFILPVAQIGSSMAPLIILVGLLIGSFNVGMIGVCLYAAVLFFQVATLPVEFNASRRGIEMLISGGYIGVDQEGSAKKVLNAAAMTYVVAALATFVSLLRMFSFVKRNNK